MIIHKCNLKGKPVVTATQMLDSMTHNLRPTRAEVTDVANAIFDGTSAIMLSGETAAGHYPVEAVKMMESIAEITENSLDYKNLLAHIAVEHELTTTNAIAHATCSMAMDLEAHAIIAATSSGETPRAIAQYRPKSPIVAVTTSEQVMRRHAIDWGVYPVLTERFSTTDTVFEDCLEKAKAAGFASDGDLVILTAGVPIGLAGSTNLLRVETVGKILIKGKGAGRRVVVTGRVCVAHTVEDLLREFHDGDIIVTHETSDDMNVYMDKATAIITENANTVSHAAYMGMLLAKPTILDAKDACSILKSGQLITLNGNTGVIYKGVAQMY